MSSQDYFDQGYALMLYSIATDKSYWRFRDEEIAVFGHPQSVLIDGLRVARIEDVRACG